MIFQEKETEIKWVGVQTWHSTAGGFEEASTGSGSGRRGGRHHESQRGKGLWTSAENYVRAWLLVTFQQKPCVHSQLGALAPFSPLIVGMRTCKTNFTIFLFLLGIGAWPEDIRAWPASRRSSRGCVPVPTAGRQAEAEILVGECQNVGSHCTRSFDCCHRSCCHHTKSGTLTVTPNFFFSPKNEPKNEDLDDWINMSFGTTFRIKFANRILHLNWLYALIYSQPFKKTLFNFFLVKLGRGGCDWQWWRIKSGDRAYRPGTMVFMHVNMPKNSFNISHL